MRIDARFDDDIFILAAFQLQLDGRCQWNHPTPRVNDRVDTVLDECNNQLGGRGNFA
jgi:hypothetical protein